jgi:hypothetical protein
VLAAPRGLRLGTLLRKLFQVIAIDSMLTEIRGTPRSAISADTNQILKFLDGPVDGPEGGDH